MSCARVRIEAASPMRHVVEVRDADDPTLCTRRRGWGTRKFFLGPTLCGRRSDENAGVNSGWGALKRLGLGSADVEVGDEGVFRRVDPVAVLGDLRIDAKGAKNRHAAGRSFVDAFDNTFADATKIGAAAFEEADSGSVAVNGGARRELVTEDDGRFRAPTDEVGFDGIAVRMIADGTFAGVAFERGIGLATGGDLGFGRSRIAGTSAFFAAAGTLLFLFDVGLGDERRFVLYRRQAGGDSVGVESLIAAGEGCSESGIDDDLDGVILLGHSGHGWRISFSWVDLIGVQ